MPFTDDVAAERRARLRAEKRLEQTRSELFAANQRIEAHAMTLSSQIQQTREDADLARVEAAALKDEYEGAQFDLARARTAMKIAERRLWSSLEAIRDGFAVFDSERILIAANPAFLSLFEGLEAVQPGCTLGDMLALMAEEGIVDTDTRSAADWKAMMMARWDEDRIVPTVIRLWNDQYYRLTERRTTSGDVVVLALNITDQIAREAQMAEARDKAEAANRAKSAFLANMSHEIRTPMNGVVGMAELLEDTDLTDEQQSFVETIRSSGEALLVIINDVLDYSKIEADKISLTSKPFDLERCIHDVVALLQRSAAEKDLELAVDYDLFMPTSFVGDAGRIRQVLTNLIGNAIKFTEEGSVTVRIVGLPGDAGRDYRIHVTVEDTGIGIPEDKLDSVFGEFQQVEDERNRAYDGTGLGLAISRKLIGLMGGEIWVDSTEGVGSGFGFHLTLPALEATDADISRAPDWVARAVILEEPGPNQQILQKQLTLLGLTLVTLADKSGLADLEPGPCDIVFLGQEMCEGGDLPPEVGTLDVAATFLLSNSLSRGRPDGVTSVLSRPVLRADLLQCLSSLTPPLPDDMSTRQGADTGEKRARVPDTSSGRRRMQVLAAEDNRTNRFVFQKMVKTLNIDLVFAENGAEAVALYEKNPPDILFTDISMPKMDGKEAARRIRQFERDSGLEHCPIIAITAHAMDGDADEILAAGIDHYLPKPLKKQAIIERIIEAQPLEAEPALPEDETASPAALSTSLSEDENSLGATG